MHPIGAGYTDVGRARDHNEDSFYLDDDRGLYIVADGMGGHASGEVASTLAINRVQQLIGSQYVELNRMREEGIDAERVVQICREAVQQASAEVFEHAVANEAQKGMGCTLTLMLVVNNKACMAHVGDTRLYLNRDGNATQLSTDHTMANELCIAGIIRPDELKDHQYASVLSRAVGTRPTVKVDTLVFEVTPGDRFLLCSDGLSGYVENEAWVARHLEGDDLESVAQELVSFANTAGGSDNITAITVEIRADEPEWEIVDEMSIDLSHQYLALESVFLFEGLSMGLHTRVLEVCHLNDYVEGDVVIKEGVACKQLMVVVDGRFTVSRKGNEDGELTAGEHVGATTLLAPRRSRATLSARSKGRMLILERKPFWDLIRARPWLGVGLLERLGRRISIDLDRSIEQRDDGDPKTTTVEPRERF